MSKRDYYDVLGLQKGVDKQAIKKAYRKLAKELHPDRNKAADADDKFKELQEAYEVLSDEQKREAYDTYGFAGTQGFGGAGGGGFAGSQGFAGADMGDLLGSFFGGSFGGFGRQQTGFQRGADMEAILKVEFMEAVFGAEKKVEYKRRVECGYCHGTGSKDGKLETCKTCKGHGQVTQIRNTVLGRIQTSGPCPTCHGTGTQVVEPCEHCAGEGLSEGMFAFEIKIPPGIPDEVTLRFREKGHAGKRSAGFGDLFVIIEVAPDSKLERRGDDIYLDQEIDVITATLGGEIEIPTVHGEVKIKVPAGTQPEKVIKLSGKGGPKFRGRGNGDQYVRMMVKIPEKISRSQRKLWESLRDEK